MKRNSNINASERRAPIQFFPTRAINQIICIALIFLSIFVPNMNAQAAPITCVPYAVGVPYLWDTWDQAPNWWNTSLQPPYYYNKTDDPRWQGAVSQTYGGGAGEQVRFRALYDSENSLYLSWRIDADPTLDPEKDKLYVGFVQPDGAGDIIIKVVPYYSTNSVEATIPFGTVTYIRSNATGTWTSGTNPGWILQYTRIWLDNQSHSWAIQMKVPNSSDPDKGIKIGKNFSMWYEIQMIITDTTTGAQFNQRWKWPRNVSSITGPIGFPPNSTWGNFTMGSTATGCGEGVSLIGWDKIGTFNTHAGHPAPNTIKMNDTNTFFASVFNGMSTTTINSYNITARFRLANWGIQPDPNNVSDKSQLWSDIRADNAIDNSNPAPNRAPILPGTFGNLTFTWTLNDTEKAPFQSGNKSWHQCILVELSGKNLTFTKDSAWNNFNFVSASNFSDSAQVSVIGLPPTIAGKRDVYLYVQKKNMPAAAPPEPLPPEKTIWNEISGISTPFTWDSSNFEGFKVSSVDTETLRINQTDLGAAKGKTRTVMQGGLTYNSTKKMKEFEASKNKGLLIDNAWDNNGNYADSGKYYPRMNLFGEPYIYLYSGWSRLYKVVMEQNASDEKIISAGDAWNIDGGWVLTVASIRPIESAEYETPTPTPETSPVPTSVPSSLYRVKLILSKDGIIYDDKEVLQGEMYTYSSYDDKPSVPAFVTYIDEVISENTVRAVRLKYTWARSLDKLDFQNSDYLNRARAQPEYFREIGVFGFKQATDDHIFAENYKEINLTSNKILPLANALNFQVTNDINVLRFYPIIRKELAVEDMPTYKVYGYYDTGEKFTEGNVTYNNTENMASFGYIVQRDEGIIGWKASLQGAQAKEIAPNLYKIAVPDNSFVTINTTIEAIEPPSNRTIPEPQPPNPPILPWWLWILLLIIILVVILLRKRH